MVERAIKQNVPIPTLCRGCLTPDRNIISLSCKTFKRLFEELTNISLSETSAWPGLCWECMALLRKCLQFRRKLIRSHNLLSNYADFQESQPGPTAESLKQTSSTLSKSNTFLLSNIGTQEYKDSYELHNIKSSYGIFYEECNKTKQEINVSDSERDYNTELEVSALEEKFNSVQFPEVFGEETFNKNYTASSTEIEVKLEKTKNPKQYKPKAKRKNIGNRKTTNVKNSSAAQSTRDKVRLDPSKVRTLTFTHNEQLQHMEEKRSDPNFLKFPFKCQLCCTGFNYEEKLLEHTRDKHQERNAGEKWYKCEVCHFYIRKYHSWKSHMYTHATVYECAICGLRGYKKTPMIEHYSYKHEGTLVPYVCNVCGKCYAKKTLFLNHMRNHANEEQVQCDHCKREYSRKDKLIVHMRQHYEDPTSRPFVCSCGYRARTAKLLEAHAIKHSTERPQYCVECDRHFKTDKSLRMHLLKDPAHADPTNFKFHCKECPRRYALRVELKYHTEREHLGIKHKCLDCGKAFSYPESLVRHTKFVHEKVKQEKIHGCEVCSKMFSTTSQLRKHTRVHTGERPYVCAHCPAAFAQTGTRATHVRLVHLKLRKNKLENVKNTRNDETPITKECVENDTLE